MLKDLKMPTTRQRVRLDVTLQVKELQHLRCLMDGTCVDVPDRLTERVVDARGPEDTDYKTQSQTGCSIKVKELQHLCYLMEGTCVGVPDGLIEFFVDARGPEDADYKTESQTRCPLQVKELHQ